MNTRDLVQASMAALVQSFGCYDAVVEVLRARWGAGVSKGTISRKVARDLDWTVADVVALEDAAGKFPVTRLLARRLTAAPGCPRPLSQHAGSIAKEAGEAVAAILSAEASAGGGDDEQAVVEIDEAMAALRAAREAIMNRRGEF